MQWRVCVFGTERREVWLAVTYPIPKWNCSSLQTVVWLLWFRIPPNFVLIQSAPPQDLPESRCECWAVVWPWGIWALGSLVWWWWWFWWWFWTWRRTKKTKRWRVQQLNCLLFVVCLYQWQCCFVWAPPSCLLCAWNAWPFWISCV